jgi:ABC-2 type transport system ATP-binding protein
VTFDRREVTAAEVVAAIVEVADVQDLSIEEPDIEDLVRRVYTGSAPPGG